MKGLGRAIGMASELGVTMGLIAAGFVMLALLGGRWLDARLGTTPVATVVGAICGAIAGQVALFSMAARFVEGLSSETGAGSTLALAGDTLKLGARALVLGVAPALVGLALGRWLDSYIGGGMYVTAVLALLGPLLGLLFAVRMVRAAHADMTLREPSECSGTKD